jgi:Uma2 family endonuclease
VATVGNAVRYPDALITCTRPAGTARLVADVAVVFEVTSPGNPGVDRITKLREYWAVPSIHTYVIVEQQSIGLMVLERRGADSWTATALTAEDTLRLRAPDLTIPVVEFYLDVDLPR